MIHNILEEQLNFMFMEGLMESLHGMIRVSTPRSLYDTIRAAYNLESIV